MTETVPPDFDYHKAALKIALKGARRLARLVQPNGRFIYRYIPEKRLVSKKYNVLRHWGAVWSMLDVAGHTGGEAQVQEAALRAGGYGMAEFVRPLGSDRLCVIDGDKIKLGGNGLALLAISEMHRAAPRPELVESARALGHYILDQRTPDGDFVHGRMCPGGEIYPFRSNYYTGEALFGLLHLHQITGEPHWRDAALEVTEALGRRDYGVAEQSHWMLYALDLADQLAPSATLRAYAARIAAEIMRDTSYLARDQSTPVACRAEGLLAYVRMARRSSSEDQSPRAGSTERFIRDCLAVQFRFFRRDGSFICGADKPDVRIDYIQHNISAFAGFSALADRAAR